jgi:hypothetical protein
MDHEDHIKLLAEHLIRAIGEVYTDNALIQEALNQIEDEGYRIDIVLAAFTRLDQLEADEIEEDELDELSPNYLVSHLLKIGGAKSGGEDEASDETGPLTAEINDFDRTFLKLIKVRVSDG